jgi:radial spoke head protein 4/6
MKIDVVTPHSMLDLQKPLEPAWSASMEVPSEPHGTGTNRYSYFVTNSPGIPWTKLSDLTPAMIVGARKIRSFFTGCLSSPVRGYPPYPGLEKDYLRAQIARITATTHISPTGFYILSDFAEEQEEEESFTNAHQGKSFLRCERPSGEKNEPR